MATRPFSANGLELLPAEAERERLRLEAVYLLLPDPINLYQRWVYMVNKFSVMGKTTQDARIAAAMLEHGLTHILTFNVRGFRRYASAGIVAVDPADLS